MPVYKAVISTWLDSTEPGDALQITPHFNDTGLGSNPENLANDLLNAWNPYLIPAVQGGQQRCTLYNVATPAPNYPVAQVTRFPDVVKASTVNRDVAVCLSFYGGENRPRKRGRLYIPACLITTALSSADVSATIMTKVAALVPIFQSLGGVDVDWGVYSRAGSSFTKATNWWVDNAWDSQRRRGKKATARQTGTTSG